MRLVVLIALFATAAFAEGITIALDFDGPHSGQTEQAMKAEVETVLKDAPLQIGWTTIDVARTQAVDNLIVVRLKGRCVLDPAPYLYDERGPMAFTYSTDSVVQPFSDVACDKVIGAVRSAMWGRDYKRADLLLGRALGRVVAHELVHMLAGSGEHGHEGVAKRSLSGNQLVAPMLRLDPSDIARIVNHSHQ